MVKPYDQVDDAVAEMRRENVDPLAAVIRLKREGMISPGREFNVANALKRHYGLSVVQLHEIVGWLRGERDLEEVKKALQAGDG